MSGSRSTPFGLPFHGQNSFQVIVQGTNRSMAYTTASASTGTFSTGVNIVRVCCSTDAYIQFGTAPSAVTGSIFLPASLPEYFGVLENYKMAVFQVASAGTCYVTEGIV